ncbi:RNA polymerase sigma factor [Pusillimonas sp.]|uniref:RNA polymerase sigma factor n=1 Tax=Pusillimonas sp. TaxID=3040095 RepID=UPI0029BD3086|nr:sigma-70 family RNA polymerase sigma factor [Pusillimonas sp.]MDX3893678.1 sigma-70 family RNA polymerase sigma factor [Pusillimonas sp.]
MSRPPVAKKGWLAHYSELVAAWRRKDMHEDSEDAMQDAVVRLLENGAAAVDNPRAYLQRSVSNGVIDRHRHQAVVPMTPMHELAENDHPLGSGPETQVFSQQLVADLKDALGELPLVCQQVYVRHRLEGWTHAEIAQAMGISRAMVEKHMTRALQHLNRKLQKYAP